MNSTDSVRIRRTGIQGGCHRRRKQQRRPEDIGKTLGDNGTAANVGDRLPAVPLQLLSDMIDPGIKIEPGYFVYDQGKDNDYFVRKPDGTIFAGRVWPGQSNFSRIASKK